MSAMQNQAALTDVPGKPNGTNYNLGAAR